MKEKSIESRLHSTDEGAASQGVSVSDRYQFPRQIHSLASVSLNSLVDSSIQGIILDLDNTIVSEDDRYLSRYAIAWIAQAQKHGLKLFILSNGKRQYRVDCWSQRLNIPAISPAKKPFPSAFRRAIKHMQVDPKQVVVIGDSRHTDILGAWLTGCPSIQVASLPHPPRWWESLLGKYVQIPHVETQALEDFQSAHFYHNP